MFNVGKCKIMHFGRASPKNDYYMKNQKLRLQVWKKIWNCDYLKSSQLLMSWAAECLLCVFESL